MIESEAKTKWCPMVRFYENKHFGLINNRNAPADNNKSHLCIGSDCMMWRWSKSVSEGYGYCGLAGRPC